MFTYILIVNITAKNMYLSKLYNPAKFHKDKDNKFILLGRFVN